MRPDSNSQTDGQQEVVTVYNVLQRGVFTSNHLFLIYRWESRDHQDHWSFLNGTPQRPGHTPEHYTCSVMTVPQQSYPNSDLAAEPSPEAAHW